MALHHYNWDSCNVTFDRFNSPWDQTYYHTGGGSSYIHQKNINPWKNNIRPLPENYRISSNKKDLDIQDIAKLIANIKPPTK